MYKHIWGFLRTGIQADPFRVGKRLKQRLVSVILIIPMVISLFAAIPATAPVIAAEPQQTIPIWQDTSYSFEERAANLVSRLTLSEKAAQLISSMANGGASITVDGKTIASYGWWNEALHGVSAITTRNSSNAGAVINTTSYPTDLTVASSWDPELLYREATMISDEAREVMPQNSLNLDFYSPTVNMQRDPRWGRNDESYGEDPLLAAAMAAQFVNGMQGQDMNGDLLLEGGGYLKTITTLKHYAANNSEGNRLNGTATYDERASREYYTAQFRKIVEMANPGSVMSSYNNISVTPYQSYSYPAAASPYLIDNLMRQTFGFEGYFTSDCDAVSTITGRHNWTPPGWSRAMNTTERSAWALAAGEDLECNTGYNDGINYRTNVPLAVSQNLTTPNGLFTENDVDVALTRLFTARMKLGEFDDVANEPWVVQARERVPSWTNLNSNNAITETPDRLAMAREVGAKSIVLLKNSATTKKDGTTGELLPMQVPASGPFNVYVIGYFSNPSSIYLGGYSSSQQSAGTAKMVNGYNGLKNAILAINSEATVTYAKGFTNTSTSASGLTTVDATAVNNAANYDYVVVYVGTDSGTAREDSDRTTLSLPGAQASLISQVAAKNPNTIVYMETVGEVDVTPFEPVTSAMLWSSYNGMRKGEALADVILGNYNPSGHLPFIWYPGNGSDTSIIPAITDYTLRPAPGIPGRTYMYYTGPLSFPFGWGLTYTTFGFSDLQIDNHNLDANGAMQVSVNVTNTGSVAGAEVVQLYVNTPDADPALQRPIKRLEGFQKVTLAAGETKSVSFTVKVPDLAFFDNDLNKWVVDSGRYGVQVSTSSADADIQLQDFVQVSGSLTPFPSVITVKPTQEGDATADIPQRVMFLEDKVVVPNVTVATSDDTLYGYILKNNSKAFPQGMSFNYSSNRPSVVSVENGVIRTVGGGVATVTATVTYNGVSKSTAFVVHVQADTTLSSILLDGQSLADFSPAVFAYSVPIPDGTPVPQVTATSTSAKATVDIIQATAIPGTATITVTSGAQQSVYTIDFPRKPNDTTLTGISVNDQVLSAFSPTVLTYNALIPTNVSDVPVVAAAANNPAATVSIVQATAVPGSATITVTSAPDQSVYTVNFIHASGGSDEFNSSTLGSQWSWLRQNAATWSLTTNPGFMRIQAEIGDMYTTTHTGKNILLQSPAADWTVEAKLVFSVRPHVAYQQGGLMVYQDDSNFVKLDWEYNGSSTRIQQIHQVNNSVQNTTSVAANNVIASSGPNTNTVWFRIVKNGTSYTSYYSADGITFTQLVQRTVTYNPVKVGLYSNQGSGTANDLFVSFDYFHLTNSGQFIKGLQAITFPAISDKTFGDEDFDPGAAASSGLPVAYSAEGSCSIVSNQVHLTGGGSCTVTASQPGDDSFMPAADESSTFNIAAPTSITISPASMQYSDQVTLQAQVSPSKVSGNIITGSIEFFIDGVSVGTSPVDAAGAASLPRVAGYVPGDYAVTAHFTSTSLFFTSSDGGPATLSVTQEDARAYYNGNFLFWTPSVKSTDASVTLSTTVRDLTAVDSSLDEYPGDIRKATVTFINRETNTPFDGCSNLPVGLVNPEDTMTGVASCDTTLAASSSTGATQYTIGVVVNGYYTRNSTDDDTIINVAQPIPSMFITGGGYLVLSDSSGMTPGTAGSKANFGFNVKYNKKGTNLQGNINLIVRSNGHVYQIKSNALSSMGIDGSQANFTSKANIIDITDPLNPITVGGNATLQMWMTDTGETTDTFAIQVLDKDGNMWFTSNWDGARTVEQPLGGGNLTVH